MIKWQRKGSVWHLRVNNRRMGWVHSGDGWGACYIYFMGKQCGFKNSISGARMRLEQLAGVESDWARERRAKMVYLTSEEKMWAILSDQPLRRSTLYPVE